MEDLPEMLTVETPEPQEPKGQVAPELTDEPEEPEEESTEEPQEDPIVARLVDSIDKMLDQKLGGRFSELESNYKAMQRNLGNISKKEGSTLRRLEETLVGMLKANPATELTSDGRNPYQEVLETVGKMRQESEQAERESNDRDFKEMYDSVAAELNGVIASSGIDMGNVATNPALASAVTHMNRGEWDQARKIVSHDIELKKVVKAKSDGVAAKEKEIKQKKDKGLFKGMGAGAQPQGTHSKVPTKREDFAEWVGNLSPEDYQKWKPEIDKAINSGAIK